MPEFSSTHSPDWNFILETIKEDKCILLLGPEIARTMDGIPLQYALIRHLGIDGNSNILKYYNQDELFLFANKAAKAKEYYKIKEFYNTATIDKKIYQLIAGIPFHLVISVSPDLYLTRVFEKNGYRHRSLIYNKTNNPEELEPPKKNDPVIYNLFGSIELEESLILTHDDLFDFLLAVIGNKNLPTELRNTFQNAKNIIFLGFEFEKWYVQLLLRLLNLHNQYYERSKYASKNAQNVDMDVEDLCKAQFRIEFIDEDTDHFVQSLFSKCDALGLCRKGITDATAMPASPIEKANAYIEQDQVAEALALLKEIVRTQKQDDLSDTLTTISARYNRVNRRLQSRNIDVKDAEQDLNQIVTDLLGFISSLRAAQPEQV